MKRPHHFSSTAFGASWRNGIAQEAAAKVNKHAEPFLVLSFKMFFLNTMEDATSMVHSARSNRLIFLMSSGPDADRICRCRSNADRIHIESDSICIFTVEHICACCFLTFKVTRHLSFNLIWNVK